MVEGTLGNYFLCKVTGIRNVKVKLFDDIERLLSQVRYAPNLRKNLIYVGTLDLTACSI